jgi:predicted O-methyltransferase YrrM
MAAASLADLLQSHPARRVLVIGAGDTATLIAIASALPPDGRLLALEVKADRVARARASLEAAQMTDRASVMHGDAFRFLHKVAGPFDLAVLFASPDLQGSGPIGAPTLLARVMPLVPPPGLVVHVDAGSGIVRSPGAGSADVRP